MDLSMAAQAEGADAIAAGVTDVPGPVLGELSSTTLTRYPHKLIDLGIFQELLR